MPRDHGRTATNRRDHEHSDGPIQAARRGTRAGGEPLAPVVRAPLEARFGHDFSTVRIHSDAEAGSAAAELRADAYTVGQDIVFGDGAFAPVTSEGERLLAHELTHVVQQSSSPDLLGERQSINARESGARVSSRTDPAERAADAAADRVVAGEPVAADLLGASTDSLSGGAAVVQRWPWDDDSSNSAPAPAPAPASDSGSSSSGGGSIWDSVTSFASTAVSDVKSAAGAVYDNYEKSTDFASLNKELGQGVDWVEKQSAAGTQAMVDSTAGIPVLSQLAQGAAWVENASTDVTGGVVKGAGDLVTGIAGGLAHPIDAAAGIEGVVEHTGGGVPFLGSTLKGIHGLYDLGVNGGGQYGNSIGDLANHVFNPLQQQEDDTQFLGALGKGIVAPGDEKDGGGWQRWKDNPLEAAARAVTNIAPMVMGVGEAAGPEAAADVSTAAADADAASAIKPPAPPAAGAFDIRASPEHQALRLELFQPGWGCCRTGGPGSQSYGLIARISGAGAGRRSGGSGGRPGIESDGFITCRSWASTGRRPGSGGVA